MADETLTKSKLARLRETRWTEAEARLVLNAIEDSGATVHGFAREHDLGAQRLYWWRKRLAVDREEQGEAEEFSFAPVVVTGLGQTPVAILRFEEFELEIIAPGKIEPGWLAQVIAATKGAR